MAQSMRATLQPLALSLMRIVAGFLYMEHGLQKILGLLGANGATAHFFSWMWVAGVLEIVGGPLILIGLYTAPVAFVLCGEMAVAYFWVHFPHGFWPIMNHGEVAVLYCFVFLFLSAAGPGPLSADAMVRHKQ